RDRRGPHDAVGVGALLDRAGGDARGPDAVGPHDDRALLARLVEILRVQTLGVLGAELEDVADLDDALDLQRLAAPHPRPAAGRASSPSARASLRSCRLWSPRTSTSTGPAFGATKSSDLIVSRGSTFRYAATSAIVLAFGVATSSRVQPGKAGTSGTPRASST